MRRSRTRMPLILVASLALLGLPWGMTPAGATTSITDVAMSTHDISARGLEVKTFTVTAHITSSEPIDATRWDPCWDSKLPAVTFVRTGGAGQATSGETFHLRLTSGTAQDGTWTATVSVTSGWDGTWQLYGITLDSHCTGSYSWTSGVIEPPFDPSYALTVTGSNPVVMTSTFSPEPVPYGETKVSMSGRLTLQDGTPVSRMPLYTGQSYSDCSTHQSPPRTAATDAGGMFRVDLVLGHWPLCLSAHPPSTGEGEVNYLYKMLSPKQQVRLTAAINPSRVNLGRYVFVSGSVTSTGGNENCNLHLQRYAAGHWHTVPATFRATDLSSRQGFTYSFKTAPPVRGNVRYRVWFPTQTDTSPSRTCLLGSYAGTISRTLLVGVV